MTGVCSVEEDLPRACSAPSVRVDREAGAGEDHVHGQRGGVHPQPAQMRGSRGGEQPRNCPMHTLCPALWHDTASLWRATEAR